jgi:phenylacetate-CoA ligase
MTALQTRLIESGYSLLSNTSKLTVWKRFKTLESNQWFPPDELAGIRWKKLKRLLVHCAANVPFYQRIWSEKGVDPAAFTSENDLVHLPIVTKDLLTAARLNGEFLLDQGSYQTVRTSGTTGESFEVPVSLDDFLHKYAGHLRQVYASGWRLGVKSATLYNHSHPQFGGKFSGPVKKDSFSNFRRLALGLAHRRMTLPPYSDSESGNDTFPALWYRKLRGFKPRMFETFEFNLQTLKNYIEREQLERLNIPIIYVLGTLTDGERRELEWFFSAKIFNRYSPHEVEGLAFACGQGAGMHIAVDQYHIEFLDDSNIPVDPGTVGHVIITDLDNYTMPLIRYRIGDLGSRVDQQCDCGRGLPLMGDISGRAKDRLTLANGRVATPSEITGHLKEIESISLFRVSQADDDVIRIDVVPEQEAGDGFVRDISMAMHKVLGESSAIEVRLVEKIALEPNGKMNSVNRI